MGSRDDFRQPVVRQIAQRAGYRCSNPSCLRPTHGPDGSEGSAIIGVAAHITAAAEGGPRFDPELSTAERASAENGVWLCQTCSRLIDVDIASHPKHLLAEWKTLAEMRAYLGIRGFAIVASRSFERLEAKLPEPISEMREDIAGQPFTREFIAMSKEWSYGGSGKSYFVYFFENHEDLLAKLKVMENYGAVVEITYNNVDRFELTEDFVEYLELPTGTA